MTVRGVISLSVYHLLFVVGVVASSETDDFCGPAFASAPLYGARYLRGLGDDVKDHVMRCYNLSEDAALERDRQFDQRRQWCTMQLFPNVDEEAVEEYFCNITREAFHSEDADVQKYRKTGMCLSDARDKFGKEERWSLELKAAQNECFEAAFPDVPAEERKQALLRLVQKVTSLQQNVRRLHGKILHCLRDYFLPQQEQVDLRRLRNICRKQMMPDVAPERLESVFASRRATPMIDDQLSLCAFKESPTGKWAKAEMDIFYTCLEDVLRDLPEAIRGRLKYQMGVDVKHQVMDEALKCESKGGVVTMVRGLRRPGSLACLLGIVKDRPYDHKMNATVVYDNPAPQKKMELCLDHGRASSPDYLSYRRYREQKEAEKKAVDECLRSGVAEDSME